MAWSTNKIFQAFITDIANNTTAMDLNSDAFKLALFNNTPTPDNTVTSNLTAFNTGQYVTANEVSDGTNWDAAGEPLTSVTSTATAGVWTFDAANTPQSGATCTLTNVFGDLIYDDTVTTPVADQGVCFRYYGGVQSVTAGTFTVVHNASGIAALNVA